MNQFNDDQYDRVCDENEALRKRVSELESALRIESEHARIQRDLAEDERGRCVALELQLADARAAARFCWSCGCQDMWKTYREEAMKKWPWMDSDVDPS